MTNTISYNILLIASQIIDDTEVLPKWEEIQDVASYMVSFTESLFTSSNININTEEVPVLNSS